MIRKTPYNNYFVTYLFIKWNSIYGDFTSLFVILIQLYYINSENVLHPIYHFVYHEEKNDLHTCTQITLNRKSKTPINLFLRIQIVKYVIFKGICILVRES